MRVTLAVLTLSIGVATGVQAQERMPPIAADRMTDAQKKAVADYKALRGTDMTGPPWTVLLRVPAHVMPALQIRMHYLNGGVLGMKRKEINAKFDDIVEFSGIGKLIDTPVKRYSRACTSGSPLPSRRTSTPRC